MENNQNDNSAPTVYDQVLSLLNIQRASLSTTSLQEVTVDLGDIAHRNVYYTLIKMALPDASDSSTKVTAMLSNNVTVTAGNPLVINPGSTYPVVVHIDTLTLETGGQIQCNTAVTMTVENFIKN